ncbi:MAG: hypothetical protein ACPGVU_11140 [Limisphaerales bacterium]
MIGLLLLVHGGIYLLVRRTTAEWRVYGNGPLPAPLELFDPFVLKSAWVAWVIGLSAIAGSVLAFKQRYRLAASSLAIMLLAAPILATGVKDGGLRNRTVSCANHSLQWRNSFRVTFDPVLATNAGYQLTNTTEFDDVLTMFEWVRRKPRERFNLYCPGQKSSGTVTGYRFVGGGLPLRQAMEQDALLVFCDAECHPPPHDHQHALTADGTYHCVHTDEMITLLEQALRQAENGTVPYSPEAVRMMKSELAKRRAMLPPP